MDPSEAEAALGACCGSSRWVREVLAAHPYSGPQRLDAVVARAFDRLAPEDWLEAFAAHPRIGDDPERVARFAHAEISAREQGGVMGAAEATRKALADGNRRYEAIFGHVFLVCATGKSADEMLAILRSRLTNDPAVELRIAAGEQRKITALRLAALGETE